MVLCLMHATSPIHSKKSIRIPSIAVTLPSGKIRLSKQAFHEDEVFTFFPSHI